LTHPQYDKRWLKWAQGAASVLLMALVLTILVGCLSLPDRPPKPAAGGPAATQPSEPASGQAAHAALVNENPYPSAASCAECHPFHYRQWSGSQHAYAQMSPVFNTMQARQAQLTNGTQGDFCIRCHTPVGMAKGEDPYMKNVNRHAVSREGVTCIACHRINKTYLKSSGRQPIAKGPLTGPIWGPTGDEGPLNKMIEKQSLATEPGKVGQQVHAQIEESRVLSSGEFCGSCHDVNGVNGFRLEEAFSEWKHAPAADRGISCQDCHMGKEPGKIVGDPDAENFDKTNYPHGPAAVVGGEESEPRKLTNHRFVGPDYSVIHPALFPFNPAAIDHDDDEVAGSEGLATIEQWLKFDWRAGWGTAEFEDKVFENPDKYEFPDRWDTVDARYAARDIIERNLEVLREMRQKRLELMRNAIWIGDIKKQWDDDGLRFDVKVENITGGHGVPTGFDGERVFWLYVKVTDANGEVVFESGDLDPNGDVRDLHSKYVHNHELPQDKQLFSLQSRFLTRNIRGPEREQVLPIPFGLTPLPFLNKSTRPNLLYGRPFGARKHRKGIEALGHRWADYHVPAEKLTGEPPYEAVVQFKMAMVPVNLLIAIQKAGFQYDMSTRDVARNLVKGFVDHQGNPIIWRRDTDDPEKNKVNGHDIVWERVVTFEKQEAE
jgi:nitrate/TMAO reductase-like tetraheme cytochrome c subunit